MAEEGTVRADDGKRAGGIDFAGDLEAAGLGEGKSGDGGKRGGPGSLSEKDGWQA